MSDARALGMPRDFDFTNYEAIYSTVTGKRDTYHDSWVQFVSAWNAVAYRFLSCSEHDRQFAESIQRVGRAPSQPERYIQERELFGFFVTGLAAIESFCYGLFAIGSMLCSQNFPMRTRRHMQNITPEKTKESYIATYQSENIARVLQETIQTEEFRDWKEIRNILCHRSAPGRQFFLGGSHNGDALWIKDIQIDEDTTKSKREWLAETIHRLLEATNTFILSHFSQTAEP